MAATPDGHFERALDDIPRAARPPGIPDAFEYLSDLVVLADATGQITWANRFTGQLTGFDPPDLVGRSIVDFLHPLTLERAAEVLEKTTTSPTVMITPADYPVRRVDGSWVIVELNGVAFDPASGDRGPSVLVLGRRSGDHEVLNEILALLADNAPLAAIFERITRFGSWRLPDLAFGVVIPELDGGRSVFGAPVLVDVASEPRAGAPWDDPAARHATLVVGNDELPEDLRIVAEGLGYDECRVTSIDDPLTHRPAVLIAWSTAGITMPAGVTFSLEAMARALTFVLQWREHVVALEHAATVDALTGVANRARFFDVLERELSHRATRGLVGVLYVDLDGFKPINDTHGHAAGDAVLVETTNRLRSAVRPGDLVARLGGDEFAVLCAGLGSTAEAEGIAARIIDAIAEPFPVTDPHDPASTLEVRLGASVGIATAPAGTAEPDALVERADHALYEAKASGRGRHHAAPA